MKKMKKVFLIIFLVLIFLSLSAQQIRAGMVPCGLSKDDPDQTGDQTVACQFCHLFVLFKNIVDFFLLKIVPPLAALMIAIGGFMYIFAYLGPGEVLTGGGKGGPALLSQAKKLITSVIFGLLIIFASWILVNTFFQLIGVAKWTRLTDDPATSEKEGWWQIDCPTSVSTTTTTTTTTQTSQEWKDWLTYNEDSEQSSVDTIDTETPSEVDSSLLESAETQLLSNSKIYIAAGGFSDSEQQALESYATEARNFFGSAYQNTVNEVKWSIFNEEQFKETNEEYVASLVERGEISSDEKDEYISQLNNGVAYRTPSGDIIADGDATLQRNNPSAVFIHEYAHSVENSLTTAEKAEYINIYYRAQESGGFVSDYASTNRREDFAETVTAYYNTNGDASLISNDPAVQQSIQERFDYFKNKGIVQ